MALAAVLAAAWALAGCGGTASSLTGGSIPIGLSTLQGRTVRSDDMAQVVSGATATLTYDANHFGRQTADASGRFSFDNIASGHYSCAIAPAAGSDLTTGWDWAFDIPANARVQLVAALWPASADLSGLSAITISPAPTTLHVGDTVQFTATALDANGQPIAGLRPSLILIGDVGDLAADGTLTVKRTGTAKLGAWVHGVEHYADITVAP